MARIGIIQLCSSPDVDANLDQISSLCQLAAEEGARALFLPENSLYLGPYQDNKMPFWTLQDYPVAAIQRLSNDLNVEILLGSFPEADRESGQRFSSAVYFFPKSEGKREAPSPVTYRKIHLFDVTTPEGQKVTESNLFTPGEELVTLPTRIGSLGLSICFDLRFPELYRELTFQGAEVIAVPAAFLRETGKDHWEPLIRARAIENQVYLAAPAQCGESIAGRQSFGHSMLVDPWGNIVANLDSDKSGYFVADINLHYLKHIRAQFPALRLRKLFTERSESH